jgi:hypothetical protein
MGRFYIWDPIVEYAVIMAKSIQPDEKHTAAVLGTLKADGRLRSESVASVTFLDCEDDGNESESTILCDLVKDDHVWCII